jgi:hypothetical protein
MPSLSAGLVWYVSCFVLLYPCNGMYRTIARCCVVFVPYPSCVLYFCFMLITTGVNTFVAYLSSFCPFCLGLESCYQYFCSGQHFRVYYMPHWILATSSMANGSRIMISGSICSLFNDVYVYNLPIYDFISINMLDFGSS